jgi:branched-chain amino acid aminotransferase
MKPGSEAMTTRCFLDGRIVDQQGAGIALSDRGFTLADGVFETIRVRAGAVVDIQAHLERLAGAMECLTFPSLSNERDLARHLQDTREANGMAEGVLRLTITRGRGLRGLAPAPDAVPTVCITAGQLPSRSDSFTAYISTRTRRNEFSPLSRIKSLSYLDNILALQEAHERGADDAVLLNARGNVACFTAANLVARFGKDMVTPPVGDGALPGTVRRRLLERLPITEMSLTPADLERADEIISTNSLGIRRLSAIGDGIIPPERELFGAASEIYCGLV